MLDWWRCHFPLVTIFHFQSAYAIDREHFSGVLNINLLEFVQGNSQAIDYR